MSIRKIESLEHFEIDSKCTFLLDTNVLIKIFYPAMVEGKSASQYVLFYQKLIQKKVTIYITGIQLSEFVNRCIRFQFDLYKNDNPEIQDFKKDYRDTEDYRESMDAIMEIVADMMKQFKQLGDNFEKISKESLLKKVYAYDFNDAMIAMMCKMNGTVLVTDDKDYINFVSEISIATSNPQLLLFRLKH